MGRWQERPSREQLWALTHEASNHLPNEILRLAVATEGRDVLDRAWREFSGDEAADFDPGSVHAPVFVPWCLYQWVPLRLPRDAGTVFPLGARYRRLRERDRESWTVRYLDALLESRFSFHDVVSVDPGVGLGLRDCLTGEEVAVLERSASMALRRGQILFAKVVTVEDVSVLDGCAAVPFPPAEKGAVIDLRRRLRRGRTPVRAETLRRRDRELIAVYLRISDRLLNPLPPVLQNTDGEDLVLGRITFEVPSNQEAFEALAPLAEGESAEELLTGASFDPEGELAEVTVPWNGEGHGPLEGGTTIRGQLRIEDNRVVAEVNSKERAQRIREILDRLLPAGSRHLSTELESAEDLLRKPRPVDRERDRKEAEFRARPEVQQVLEDYMRSHYRRWESTAIPALGGRTPREAMRSRDGREMVEALLLDIEQRMDSTPGLTPAILAELRLSLGAGSG